MIKEPEVILRVSNIKKVFGTTGGLFRKGRGAIAVDNVNLTIKSGETLGLVGESGSGKTTLGRMILGLIEPTNGDIFYEGTNFSNLSKKEMQKLRRSIQIVFQDPQSSLNPRMTIKTVLQEPFIVHGIKSKEFAKGRILELISKVGLSFEHLNRFPHEFSGGQRQRICIARALVLNPRLLVLDEPTSSLDVSVQTQILNLLQSLQKELGLTYLFISHDLAVVRQIAERIAVMYAGKIVEIAQKIDLFDEPLHPYTQALISAIPIPDPHLKVKRLSIDGEPPSPFGLPSGCRFHPRCPYCMTQCVEKEPKLREVAKNHFVACHKI
jgi:oligopeptide/dipeptide ABC transporter ATP-binding protein